MRKPSRKMENRPVAFGMILILLSVSSGYGLSPQVKYKWTKSIGGSLDEGARGIATDSAGNVYLTGKGVTVFDRRGTRIGRIEVPEPWTGNVCFGGKDRKTLFIAANAGLYAMRMSVAGVE